MSHEQPDAKCAACNRTVAAHALGCSMLVCPHRKAQAWCGTEGSQGFPGTLAEERVLQRLREKDRAVQVNVDDL